MGLGRHLPESLVKGRAPLSASPTAGPPLPGAGSRAVWVGEAGGAQKPHPAAERVG